MQDNLSSLTTMSTKQNYQQCLHLICHSWQITNPHISVADELHTKNTCIDFAKFFIEKIQGIRKAVSTSMPTTVPILSPKKCPEFILQINCKILEETVQWLSSSSCCVDVMKGCFPSGLKDSNHQTIFEKEKLGQIRFSDLQANFKPLIHQKDYWKMLDSTFKCRLGVSTETAANTIRPQISQRQV